MSRTPLRVLLVAVTTLLTTAFGLSPAPASAASPYCGITWGSQPKTHGGVDGWDEYVENVRAGRHRCFDRLVIDLGDAHRFDAFSVRYVPGGIRDGADQPVRLRGGAALEVEVQAKPYDSSNVVHYNPENPSELVDVRGFRTFRQVSWVVVGGDRTSVGIGTRARLPFRAFMLPGPGSDETRLVIDVAHRW